MENGTMDQLTPIPSLLRKEGSAHDPVSPILKNLSVQKQQIQNDIENEDI